MAFAFQITCLTGMLVFSDVHKDTNVLTDKSRTGFQTKNKMTSSTTYSFTLLCFSALCIRSTLEVSNDISGTAYKVNKYFIYCSYGWDSWKIRGFFLLKMETILLKESAMCIGSMLCFGVGRLQLLHLYFAAPSAWVCFKTCLHVPIYNRKCFLPFLEGVPEFNPSDDKGLPIYLQDRMMSKLRRTCR